MSGNCVIGRLASDMMPRQTISTEITQDKIGRFINVSNIVLKAYLIKVVSVCE